MRYERPLSGLAVLAILIIGMAITYCGLYATVWVLKYFWLIV